MVVDDSMVARAVLSRMIEADDGPLLLIDIDALIAGPPADRAAA